MLPTTIKTAHLASLSITKTTHNKREMALQTSTFLTKLPGEVRNKIYEETFKDLTISPRSDKIEADFNDASRIPHPLALLHVCREIREEAQQYFVEYCKVITSCGYWTRLLKWTAIEGIEFHKLVLTDSHQAFDASILIKTIMQLPDLRELELVGVRGGSQAEAGSYDARCWCILFHSVHAGQFRTQNALRSLSAAGNDISELEGGLREALASSARDLKITYKPRLYSFRCKHARNKFLSVNYQQRTIGMQTIDGKTIEAIFTDEIREAILR